MAEKQYCRFALLGGCSGAEENKMCEREKLHIGRECGITRKEVFAERTE